MEGVVGNEQKEGGHTRINEEDPYQKKLKTSLMYLLWSQETNSFVFQNIKGNSDSVFFFVLFCVSRVSFRLVSVSK